VTITLKVGITLTILTVVGSIPESFGNLRSLESLYLDGNELSGPLTAVVSKLPRLSEIRYFGNHLESGSILFFVLIFLVTDSPRSLTKMSVDLDNIHKALMQFYYACDGRKWLHSDGWGVDKPKTLSRFNEWFGVSYDSNTGFFKFILPNNNISGPLSPSLSSVKSLCHLDLSNNKLHGPIPESIWGLKKLTYLDLSKNQFSGQLSLFAFDN
jgi:Leucine-rich repeat (LRR) protein